VVRSRTPRGRRRSDGREEALRITDAFGNGGTSFAGTWEQKAAGKWVPLMTDELTKAAERTKRSER
jgi:hypothetical protein